MAKMFRIYKPDIFSIVRNFGTQRYHQNYYEILNVSPNASQKEIKQAFIRLSKQLHPDISGKYTHDDFVKLNEAYSILGKENTRRQYDVTLKARYDPYSAQYNNSQNIRHESRWEYDIRTARSWSTPPQQAPDSYFGLLVALFFLGLGFMYAFAAIHSFRIRKMLLLKSVRLEQEYQKNIQNRKHKKPINELESAADLNEYLEENRKY